MNSNNPRCSRKIRYPNEVEAKRGQQQHEALYGEVLNVYHCIHCQGWHIGGGWREPRKDTRK